LLLTFSYVHSQSLLRGFVLNQQRQPLSGASIQSLSSTDFTYANVNGYFELPTNDLSKIQIQIRYVGYVAFDSLIQLPQDQAILFMLNQSANTLTEISVEDSNLDPLKSKAPNRIAMDASSVEVAPSANMDFNQIIKTLPGVSSNNELSSAYQVRGGNFDENLVYVNDIPIYRPFLANTGRQEGLSFVNPSLVQDIAFYAGGWEAKYGDKLSSSLNISYKEPQELEGNLMASLLGGSVYLGNRMKNDRVSYLIGGRYRDTRYLLNSLEVEGAYFPKFTDIQSLVTFDLTSKQSAQKNKTKLSWLNSYSRNRYLTIPTSQVTEFGSVTTNLRIQTAFQGRETLAYDTYQSGVNLSRVWNEHFATQLIGSVVLTQEQENFEVEGAYRLCDVDNNPNSGSFDECIIVRGVGSQYDYGRNVLDAQLLQLETRNTWLIDEQNLLEFGVGISKTMISDSINEYSFQDSASYVSFTQTIFNELAVDYQNLTSYAQYTYYSTDSTHRFNGGIRANFWTQNTQTYLSPRLSYTYTTKGDHPLILSLSAGAYQQLPFYREFRTYQGDINTNVSAQQSYHMIMGIEKPLQMWNRPFLLSTQVYFKWLTNLIPYDIENMRLRYHTDQPAEGYATGMDVRLNGEFVPGTQSWFSLSLLKTAENLTNFDYGWQRRPTDQRVQIGVFFEDHLPDDPSIRVYLNLQFGSGFAFGPPGNFSLRGRYQGDEYYRADLGLSKSFRLGNGIFQKGWIRLEVLNALGADNTLSYSWIQDVTGASFAIPNSLSARLLNLRLALEL
jgi:hypothetical protein